MLTATEGERLAELRSLLDPLSHREKLVLHAICERGLINKEIAREQRCCERTIEAIRARLFAKLGVTTAAALGVLYGEWKTLDRHERGGTQPVDPTEEPVAVGAASC